MACLNWCYLLSLLIGLLYTQTADTQVQVVKTPSPLTVMRGEKATMKCELNHPFNGSGTNYYLNWGQITAPETGESEGTLLGVIISIDNEAGEPYYTYSLPYIRERYSIDHYGNNYDLVIIDTEIEDDVEYMCFIDAISNIEEGVRLTVAVEATDNSIYNADDNSIIYDDETPIVVREGDSFGVMCQTRAGRPATLFTWHRNSGNGNTQIECTASECESTSLNGDGTYDSFSTYRFNPTPSDNGVTFSCIGVQDAAPVDTPKVQEIILEVEYAPIVSISWDVTVPEAVCVTDSNPSEISTYSWYINETLQTGETTSVWEAEKESDWPMDIKCSAENSIGVGEGNISVEPYKIGQPYSIMAVSDTVMVDIGDDARLTCNVTSYSGELAGSVEWMRPDGSLVSESGSEMIESGITESWLVVDSVQDSDLGSYTCQIAGLEATVFLQADAKASSTNSGAIIGGCVAAGVVLIIIICAVVYLCAFRDNRGHKSSATYGPGYSSDDQKSELPPSYPLEKKMVSDYEVKVDQAGVVSNTPPNGRSHSDEGYGGDYPPQEPYYPPHDPYMQPAYEDQAPERPPQPEYYERQPSTQEINYADLDMQSPGSSSYTPRQEPSVEYSSIKPMISPAQYV